jgi:toxin ParE1/3/4
MPYVLRPLAQADLDNHAYYFASNGGIVIGERFLDRARECFELLGAQPNSGWPAQMRVASLRGMRFARLRGFERIIVLYLPGADAVEILRVVHGSRNLDALLRRRSSVL